MSDEPKRPNKVVLGLVLTVLVAVTAASIVRNAQPQQPAQHRSQPAAPSTAGVSCRQDFKCWGEQHKFDASLPCKRAIERFASLDARWTNFALDTPFSGLSWDDPAKGTIAYYGDSVEFQNGLGAWMKYNYRCDFDPATKTVINAWARPGMMRNPAQ
jgi:hypothetical protein